jgi:hypothetical protein
VLTVTKNYSAFFLEIQQSSSTFLRLLCAEEEEEEEEEEEDTTMPRNVRTVYTTK